MKTITLSGVLPEVFRGRTDIVSEVWNKDVEFHRGEKYLLEANSGTGKSSLCSFIYGYRNDYQGQIFFDGENIATYRDSQWVSMRKKHIALLWQELRLFPELTAMENVEIKNTLTGHCNKKRIREMFEMLGIADKADSPVAKLSYGQQQRVAMIRTLCQPSDFILVDEPVSHLDDTNAEIMMELLTTEVERQGAGIIVTSIGKRLDLNYDKTFRL